MRWLLVTAAFGAVLLVNAPVAEAKLCVRIDAPRDARVGDVVTVRVTTLEPTTWEGTRPVGLRRAAVGRRLQLSVSGPAGFTEVTLRRTSDPAVATTRLRLGRRGLWTLTVAGWDHAPRACAPPARIRVR